MKEKITGLRIKIDGLSQLVKELKPISSAFNSDELHKSYNSLILAKAWLGKVLGELGQETPYKNDGNRKTKEDIEETADTAKTVAGLTKPFNPKNNNGVVDTWELNGRSMGDYDNKSHIEKVDWLRQEIRGLVKSNDGFDTDNFILPPIARTYFIWYAKYMMEARFWLGFELQRIKEEK